ncbi:MAG: efflux RND transporter permease subunit [Gracilimonas sp.]|uniref:efflux RND transporter permease subunit n=1 Tax=Gracilimonas TaxID=649462 RepID=UPI001B2C5CD5|nr:efflux RND transporter permease subunit [Gracilimonas sp.]MBO6585968.1 efflux RND transporter permease subunit [Gracilimonas sp.]MBO6616965.1 efflux RND transporter permease subunit [Gracilimonas sp.]
MSLSSLSIRRPVLATVFSIVIVLFGIISFNYLPVREYPAVDPPIVTVSTSYIGANAEVIESQITEPLEEEINGIAGIKNLTSVSREGRSTVTVEFNLDVDLETAANDVRARVSRAVGSLPPDADPPVVSKADADARPILFFNIKSDSRNLLQLTDVAINYFKERVQTIDGVSSVQIWGDKTYSMRLWLDPMKLAAYDLTPLDVRNALSSENVELPSGRIEGDLTELTVRTMGRMTTVEEFNDLIISQRNGSNIKLRDLGYAELGPQNERTILKRDGVPMVGVVLIPQPGANQIEIADEFYKRADAIEEDLPADIETAIGFDTTEYVRASIDEVQQTIFIAFLLVIAIIFLFLRDWRTTIIPVVVIPIALIGAFFVMYMAGFSINVLTLLAIVLAIGLVVDDAIVVLENIYAKIEQGLEPTIAGILGSKEIFFAVIATSAALVSVFMPILFLGGITGRLFREFGVVIAGAVIISSFVALTLTPMLSTKLLKKRERHNKFYEMTEPFFIAMNKAYKNSLQTFMNNRWVSFLVIAASGGLIYLFMMTLPQEIAPLEDRSRVRMFAQAPEGASYEYMDNYMDRLITLVQDSVPEAKSVISVTSPGFGASSSVNSGFAFAILKEPENRERSQDDVANDLSQLVTSLSGAQTFVSQEQTIGSSRGGLPVQYVLQNQNFEKLKEVIPEFLEEVRNNPMFTYQDVDLKFNKPELQVSIDRERAQDLGVSVRDIAETLQLSLSGQRFDFFIMNGKQYQVIGQVSRANRNEPVDLKSLYVRNNSGRLIQLDNLVTVAEQSSPPQLYRFNRYASATISASLAPGYTIADGIETMDEIAEGVLDDTFVTSLAGPSRDFVDSSSSLGFIFLLALALVYLVLSAQFESFRDPFTIMLTVPLALAGALLSMWYFNETLNIFSQIGMIMLIGLVTKNGILIVEFANQRQRQGLSIMDAILDASAARFRPILMTSISTVLGILPIALALGAGAESRTSMGIAVIGGLIIGSLLTLYVIPAMYSYLSPVKSDDDIIDEETIKKAEKELDTAPV